MLDDLIVSGRFPPYPYPFPPVRGGKGKNRDGGFAPITLKNKKTPSLLNERN